MTPFLAVCPMNIKSAFKSLSEPNVVALFSLVKAWNVPRYESIYKRIKKHYIYKNRVLF